MRGSRLTGRFLRFFWNFSFFLDAGRKKNFPSRIFYGTMICGYVRLCFCFGKTRAIPGRGGAAAKQTRKGSESS